MLKALNESGRKEIYYHAEYVTNAHKYGYTLADDKARNNDCLPTSSKQGGVRARHWAEGVNVWRLQRKK